MSSKTWHKESEELPIKDVLERCKQTVIAIAVKGETIINYQRYSTLNKLLRMIAYMLRFIYNIKVKDKKRRLEIISVILEINEIKLAIVRLSRRVQG